VGGRGKEHKDTTTLDVLGKKLITDNKDHKRRGEGGHGTEKRKTGRHRLFSTLQSGTLERKSGVGRSTKGLDIIHLRDRKKNKETLERADRIAQQK